MALVLSPAQVGAAWTFVDVTHSAGVLTTHGHLPGGLTEIDHFTGGAAAGDVDGDGDLDLFVLRGGAGPSALFRNEGNGTFIDVASPSELALPASRTSGATFADVDGDGTLDLLVGGVRGTGPGLFLNDGAGVFVEHTSASGLSSATPTHSAALGDYDRDGRIDLFLAHWNPAGGSAGHLWRNLGGGRFVDVGVAAGIDAGYLAQDWSFTPNFADIDGDGLSDLLIASDFGTSRVFGNRGDGTFEFRPSSVITDENGMGAAIGDYDNDGDLDWFVSSIWDPNGTAEGNWGVTGNRLYRNTGDGTFEDATDAAGVRKGYWGWGSVFADLNNDGHLDLFHVNGHQSGEADEFHADSSRLFIGNGDGTFVERSAALGLVDKLQGRGVVCFDYDRDGDLDLFVSNNAAETRLFRNDGGNDGHYLTVRLRARGANTFAVGARVWVTTPDGTQMREMQAGNNFLSSNPIETHFGLGAHTVIDTLRVRWPDGLEQTMTGVAADRVLTVTQAAADVTPELLRLWNAGPNPFGERAQFAFTLPSATHVRLRLLDLSGRVVRALGAGTLDAGTHTLEWNGLDGNGRRVPAGIYFGVLEADGHRATVKVIRID